MRRAHDYRHIKVTLELDLNELMVLTNAANLGAAVIVGVRDAPTFDHIELANGTGESLADLGPDRWNAMMKRISDIGAQALQAHGVTDITVDYRVGDDIGGPVQ